ncbi:MAG: endonuclease III [Deltaproteobacteria bacterium]|nr:endonuclease III [Deltaproteobacteria bacterium]
MDKRAVEIIKILNKTYPKSRTSLHYKTSLQLLIATILAAQCTDERVNKITPSLFTKYKSSSDFARAQQKVLEEEIRSAGLYKNKAKNIIGSAKIIAEKFDGKVPDSMEKIITLPGVARKTGNVVLGNGFGIASGIVVDTHIKRLSYRIGLTENTNPEKVEKDLIELIPKKDWIDFAHRLVKHGRQVCIARKPDCDNCGMKSFCEKNLKKD